MKIAIVYDWVDKIGGVERLLTTLLALFPDSDFYTSYIDRQKAPWAKDLLIHTSFIQKFPNVIKHNRFLSSFFYPYAFESFDFSTYNIVISISSSFAKGIITRPETKHISIILTPPRYLWDEHSTYLAGIRKIGYVFLEHARKWDYIASQRPNVMLAISKRIQKKIKKYYHRDSEVLYPPFDQNYWNDLKPEKPTHSFFGINSPYYLVVSRLEPYKRVDLAIQACNKLNKKLVIVGCGSLDKKLRMISRDQCIFLGKISDEELAYCYQHAQALIMPQKEDFGYVALEAQYYGCPVITYKESGARELIENGRTGCYFDEQTVESLIETLENSEKVLYTWRQRIIERKDNPFAVFALIAFKNKLLNYIS